MRCGWRASAPEVGGSARSPACVAGESADILVSRVRWYREGSVACLRPLPTTSTESALQQ